MNEEISDEDLVRIFVFRPYVPVLLKKGDVKTYEELRNAISKQCGLEIRSVHRMAGMEVQRSEDIACDNLYIAVEKQIPNCGDEQNETRNNFKDNLSRTTRKSRGDVGSNASVDGSLSISTSQSCSCSSCQSECDKMSLDSNQDRKVNSSSDGEEKGIRIIVRNLYSPTAPPSGCTLKSKDLTSMSRVLLALGNQLSPPGGCFLGLYDDRKKEVTSPRQIKPGGRYLANPHLITSLGYEFLHGLPSTNGSDWVDADRCSRCGNQVCKDCARGDVSDYSDDTKGFETKSRAKEELPVEVKVSNNLEKDRKQPAGSEQVDFQLGEGESHTWVSMKSESFGRVSEFLSGRQPSWRTFRSFGENLPSAHSSRSFRSLREDPSLVTVPSEYCPESDAQERPSEYCTDSDAQERPFQIFVHVNTDGPQPAVPCRLTEVDRRSLRSAVAAVAKKLQTPEDKAIRLLTFGGAPVEDVGHLKDGQVYTLDLKPKEDTRPEEVPRQKMTLFPKEQKRNRIPKTWQSPSDIKAVEKWESEGGAIGKEKRETLKQNEPGNAPKKFLILKEKKATHQELTVLEGETVPDIIVKMNQIVNNPSDPIVRLYSRDGKPIESLQDVSSFCVAVSRSQLDAEGQPTALTIGHPRSPSTESCSTCIGVTSAKFFAPFEEPSGVDATGVQAAKVLTFNPKSVADPNIGLKEVSENVANEKPDRDELGTCAEQGSLDRNGEDGVLKVTSTEEKLLVMRMCHLVIGGLRKVSDSLEVELKKKKCRRKK